MSIESVTPSSHLILCHPLLLPPIPPSIRIFSNESTLRMRWPEYWSFSFNISPSNEHPGLISFRMDWLDLLEVQGTRKSLLQHRSSKQKQKQKTPCTLVAHYSFFKNLIIYYILFFKLRYSWFIRLYWFQVYNSDSQFFIDYTPFKVVIKCWLYCLCCTIYPCG